MKIYLHETGFMTKMAATPIYGKNPSKIFFSRTSGPISTKLGMERRYVSIEGQGHLLTLAQGRVHTKFQTEISQKLLC